METGPESTPERARQQPEAQPESGGRGYTPAPAGQAAGPRPVPDGFGFDEAAAWTGTSMAGAVGAGSGGGAMVDGPPAIDGDAETKAGPAIMPWWAEPSGDDSAGGRPRAESAGATGRFEGDTLFPVQHGRRRPKVGRRAKSHRHSRLTAVAVTLAAVVALVVGLVEVIGSGSALPTGSSGIVLASAQTTLAAKTADLHMTIAVQGPGDQITATGNGAVDFADDTSQATITYADPSQVGGLQMHEVFAGGNVFLSMPEISQLVPGKSWVAAPVTASNSLSPGSTNPAAMFTMLTSEGFDVTPLGPSTIDGDAVQGYHVAITPAELMKGVDRADLPPSVGQEVKSVFGTAGVQMSVYVGDATHLLRRITFSMHLSAASASVSVQATEDISNYGAPVSISAPPADQVASLQQFEQAALSDPGAAGQTGTVTGSA